MGDLATAWRRIERVLRRSTQAGPRPDSPARAQWTGGATVVCTHANGTQVLTDLPVQMGGAGAGVTPGWLLRAGLASCVAINIAALAATEGIELAELEVVASSQSDPRGLFGINDAEGKTIHAGPRDMALHVRIRAADATAPERLRALVERAHRCAPVSDAVQSSTPITLEVQV